MIKYLEVPDFHYAPEWSEISEKCAEAVRIAAIENKVDFIALPGDFFDKPLYASNRSKYNIVRKIIKSWLAVCPVVAIEGTPSHDAIGCYGPLEEMGLVLLNPKKVYGYYPDRFIKTQKRFNIHEIKKIDKEEDLGCILFGIPELNKSNIHAKLSRSAEEGNAEAVNLLSQHIQEFVGPMRLKYKDIPAIGLIHGAISDTKKEHSTDVVIKASDIVIDTDILRLADLDRWSAGHFHCKWESENICCGYAGYPGIDSNPWGKRDFVPAMNLIEITDESSPRVHDIIRIPYGTPMRKKISSLDNVFQNSNVAYWIETDDPDETLPEGLHPWSRITYIEEQTETRRVTKKQAEEAKTLWDLFKLIDPEVDPKLKELVDSIPVSRNNIDGNKLDARLTSVKVWGCILFDDKDFYWDLTQLATGLNQLIGTNGNGDGKSSALGFCSFHPQIIGKDTKSGRVSAVKDFFDKPDSGYEKYGIVNGQKHHQLVTIKGAHTQNPKTECYLDIDGIPQLEKATFDTMKEKCEELYGNYKDYLLTTFYEQPQQSRNQRSGLMTATMTEARNLVQNIAGIDREKEKRYALDQVAANEKDEQQLNSDINALEKYAEDIDELEGSANLKTIDITALNCKLKSEEIRGMTAKKETASLQLKYTENEKAKAEQTRKQTDIVKLGTDIGNSKRRILEYQAVATNLKTNQDNIHTDDESKKLEQDYSNLLIEYNRIMGEFEKSVIAQGTTKREQQTIIDNAEKTKLSHNREIELISEPCENCGYIKPDIQSQIDELNNSISLLDESIKMSGDNIASMIDLVKPEIVEPIKPPESLTEFERETIQDAVTEGLKAETAIAELEEKLKESYTLLDHCKKDLHNIIIDDEIDFLLPKSEEKLATARRVYTEIKSDISTFEAEKKAIEDRLEKAKKGKQELEDKRKKLLTSEVNKKNWNYIAKMLNPDKIPALELDIILDSIDVEATRNIKPLLEGRYSYHTETQKQGDKKSVDKFDVMIHDGESGKSFSMFYTNPGNKAFYSDCYIKALIRKRNERQMRSYSPIIYDEADGPVNPIRVEAYYNIQEAYFRDEKVLIVSQKDISTAYVKKVFNIEEMKS